MSKSYYNDDDDIGINCKKNMLSTDDESEEEILQRDYEIPLVNDDEWPDASASKITCKQNCTDCSNVFKAFIGSYIIGVPFAVHQAGVILSIIGIFFIAVVTDHCCALIVKCKSIVIANIMLEREAQGIDKESRDKEADNLGRTLSFGSIGKSCMGKAGLLAVNISIMVTQFGFTVGYLIFLGNTLRSVFKHFLVPNRDFHNLTTAVPTGNTSFIHLAATALPYSTTVAKNTSSMITNATFSNASLTTLAGFMKAVNSSTTFNFLRHHLHRFQHAVENPMSGDKLLQNSSVTFVLLVLIPIPILVAFSFVRNLRKLGPISIIANQAIVIAWFATVVFMLIKRVGVYGWPSDIAMFKFSTFAVFFGQVTGAYEGIGTVIPVEGSMAENRRKYPCFLHISLVIYSILLGSFGIIGYVSYSDKTCQIITQNLRGDIAIALQLLLFVGVLFTYPMQLFPIVQITEHLFLKFKRWRISRNKKLQVTRMNGENWSEDEALLVGNKEGWTELSAIRVKAWEGNLIRVVLIILTGGFAVVFRSQFAYIAALTGSIGSSLLSYILPPLFYLNLMKNRGMSRIMWLKNWVLIIFGVALGIMGLVVTLKEIVDSFGKGHPQHC